MSERRSIAFYQQVHEFRGLQDGPSSTLAFGVHGTETPPIEVGEEIVDSGLVVQRGLVRVVFGDPLAIIRGVR